MSNAFRNTIISYIHFSFDPSVQLQFYQMKRTPHIFCRELERQSDSLKIFLSIKRRKRLKQDSLHYFTNEDQTKDRRHSVFPVVDRGKELSSIIIKQKRQYSGYKQSLTHHHKLRSQSQDQIDSKKAQTSRKYEINFRNIQKLRKRYSFEPPYQRVQTEPNEGIIINPIKSLPKMSLSLESEGCEPSLCASLTSKHKDIHLRKHVQSSKTIFSPQNNVSLLSGRTPKLSCFQQCIFRSAQAASILVFPETLVERQSVKIAFQSQNQFKKRFQRKIDRLKSQRVKDSLRLNANKKGNQDTSVSGWSNQSFEEKKRPRFFDDLSERLFLHPM